jgi:hypothetical protein
MAGIGAADAAEVQRPPDPGSFTGSGLAFG